MILALLLGAACTSGPDIKRARNAVPQDVIGVWCGSSGEVLDIKPDSRITVDRIARDLIEDLLGDEFDERVAEWRTVPTTGSGTWELFELAGWYRVGFRIRTLGGHDVVVSGGVVVANTSDGDVVLLYHDDDPDLGYEKIFRRCGSPSAK